MHLTIHLHGHQADQLSRELVDDLLTARNIETADLVMRPAGPGEKGAIEEIGSVAVTVLNAGGAQFLVQSLQSLFHRMNPPEQGGEKVIRVEVAGDSVELRGAMSNDDFRATSDRVLRLLEKG